MLSHELNAVRAGLHGVASSVAHSNVGGRSRPLFRKIKWFQVVQSIFDGAGNTIGSVCIYGIILFFVFVWFRKKVNKNADGHDNGNSNSDPNFLESAASISKPAYILSRMSGANAPSATSSSTVADGSDAAWI